MRARGVVVFALFAVIVATASALAIDAMRARLDADRAALCDRAVEQGRAHARDYGMPLLWMVDQMSVCEGERSEWI